MHRDGIMLIVFMFSDLLLNCTKVMRERERKKELTIDVRRRVKTVLVIFRLKMVF